MLLQDFTKWTARIQTMYPDGIAMGYQSNGKLKKGIKKIKKTKTKFQWMNLEKNAGNLLTNG